MPNNENILEPQPDHDRHTDASPPAEGEPPNITAARLHHGIGLLRAAISKLEDAGAGPSSLVRELGPFSKVIVPQLCRAYRVCHIGESLPLSKEAESLADSLVDLHRAMASTYQTIFEQVSVDGLSDHAMVGPALTSAHYAHGHHMDALLLAYESYRVEPAGVWREIHQVYRNARASGIENIALPDFAGLTLKKVYKHALLLGLSNPYHLPFRVISEIDRMLPVWLDNVKLSARLPSAADRCVFLVDEMLDAPGVPLLSNSAIPRFGDHLFLETSYLADDLRRQTRGLAKEVAQGECLHTDCLAKIERLKTLRPLIKRWSSHKIRSSKRTSRRDAACDLVIGTHSVTRVIQGPGAHTDVKEPIEIVSGGDSPSNEHSRQLLEHDNVIHMSSDWQIRDSSAYGFRLAFRSSRESNIQVNELVAVKPSAGDQNWLTGLVRWAKVGGGGTLEIGVRTFARDARPVAISSYSTWTDDRAVYFLALLLPAGGKSSGSIIIPRTDLFDPGLARVKCRDGGEWTIKFKRAISVEPSFFWYQIDSRTPYMRETWPVPEDLQAPVTERVVLKTA